MHYLAYTAQGIQNYIYNISLLKRVNSQRETSQIIHMVVAASYNLLHSELSTTSPPQQVALTPMLSALLRILNS